MLSYFKAHRQIERSVDLNRSGKIRVPELPPFDQEPLRMIETIDAKEAFNPVPSEHVQPFAMFAPEVSHTSHLDITEHEWHDHSCRVQAVLGKMRLAKTYRVRRWRRAAI